MWYTSLMLRFFLFFLIISLVSFLPKTVYGATSKTISFTQVITPLSASDYSELKELFDSAKKNMKHALSLTEHHVKLDKYHRLLLAYKLSPFDKAYLSYAHPVNIVSHLSLPAVKNTHPPG